VSTHRTAIVTLLLAALPLACVDDDVRAPPDVVFAQFDPAAGPEGLPAPNDLVLLPAGRTAPRGATAQAAFSAGLAPESLGPGAIVVLDLAAMAPVEGVTVDLGEEGQILRIEPPGGAWPPGARIAVVLLGGDDGLRGAEGQPVVASPAFFFARSPEPVATCVEMAPGCESASPFLPVEQAVALEGLRQALAPLFAGLEGAGIPREDVVVAWTFTVSAGAADQEM
jgi:hypothetical protein